MRNIPIPKIAAVFGLSSDSEMQVTGYQIDSRTIQPGELFFALKGERTDGHNHLSQAKLRGAVGAVVSKSYKGPDFWFSSSAGG